jgi:AcrR family transcriptional regulator
MPRLPHSTERGRETQRVLRDALLELVVEKGFDSVTIKDITERAGVDRTTFYLHARDKTELFERSQRQMLDEVFEGTGATSGIGERTSAALRQMAEHATAYRALLAVPDADTDRRLNEYLAGHIERTLRARTEALGQAPALPPDLVAVYAANALRGLAKWWLDRGMPYSPEEMASIFQCLLQHGISAYVGGGENQNAKS